MNFHLQSIVFCLALTFRQFPCATFNENLRTSDPLTNDQLKQACGISSFSQARIIGGEDAKSNQWPWIAAIFRQDLSIVACGGAIISNRYVLTAAHCRHYRNSSTWRDVSTITVRLAHLDELSVTNGQSKLYTLTKYIAHENYDRTTLQNDIALLELSTSVPFSESIAPICVPESPDLANSNYENMNAMVIGWGRLNNEGNYSPKLQQLNVKVVPLSKCGVFGKIKLTDTQICTRDANRTKSACVGDSGGPLMLRDKNGQENVIGVVSFGSTCTKHPFIYTRVASYLDWIKKNAGI